MKTDEKIIEETLIEGAKIAKGNLRAIIAKPDEYERIFIEITIKKTREAMMEQIEEFSDTHFVDCRGVRFIRADWLTEELKKGDE